MNKLKREIEYLERGMQRIRMKLTNLQQDPTQIPVTSRVGSRPKKIISQPNYNDERDQGRNQESYISTLCVSSEIFFLSFFIKYTCFFLI